MATKPKVDYPTEVENAYEEFAEPAVVVQPTVETLQADDRAAAASLSNYPNKLPVSAEVLDRLIRLGIAIDTGDGFLIRGGEWNKACNV